VNDENKWIEDEDEDEALIKKADLEDLASLDNPRRLC